MKNILTTARNHGSTKHQEIVGVNAPHREHRRAVKELRVARKHPLYAEVITWRPVRRFKLERVAEARPVEVKPKSIVQKVIQSVKPKPRTARKSTSLMAQRVAQNA